MRHSLAISRIIGTAGLLCLTACGPALDALHATAKSGTMPSAAALHTVRTATISAPPAVVWSVLTDVPRWPAWHSAVRSATAANGVAIDAPFVWNQEGTTIHSRFAVVDSAKTLGWTGSVSIASAVHFWRLSPTGAGTKVEVEESMWGPGLSMMYPQKKLDANVERWLADLKAEAERHAAKP
jgi:hypothetical protein